MNSLTNRFLCSRPVKAIAFAAAISAATFTTTANAGFLDDFYTSAGASVNTTAPQAYSNQAMSVINGGSLVFRAPVRNVQPFTFTPPSLKAGCGGIDIFLGSFGIINKEAFIQFMKNIGQNAAGLAFKVALHAISPELAGEIQNAVNMLNKYTEYFQNSCAAANALLSDTGAEKWIHDTVWSAAHSDRSSGTSGDMADSYEKYKNRGGAAIAGAPRRTNSGGIPVDAAELNITWSALQSANLGLSTDEERLLLSLLGTVVVRKQGTGDDMVLVPDTKTATINNVAELVGPPEGNTTLRLITCSDSDCLNPSVSSAVSMKLLGAIVHEKAVKIRNNIINRTSSDPADIRALTVVTGLPIYRIIQATTLPNLSSGLTSIYLETYTQAVAYELASHYMESVAAELRKALSSEKESNSKATKAPYLAQLLKDINDKQEAARSARMQLYNQISQQGSQLAQIEQLERQLTASIPASLASNLRFRQ